MSGDSTITGKLEFPRLAEILKDLYQRKATGELALSAGRVSKKVFFKSGLIIFAFSNLEKDRLGNVLRDHGVISQEQFDETTRQIEGTKKKQGTILVQMGVLSPKDLFQGLKASISLDGHGTSYAAVGRQLGMSESAIKVAAHRMRKQYRELLRAHIRSTTASPADVDEEIQHLFTVFGH